MKYLTIFFMVFIANTAFARTAEENRIFKENTITLKNFLGYYPTFKDKRYASVNKSIKHFIYKELYDKENDDWLYPRADYALISNTNNFINFSISYNLGGASGHWFNKYYVVSKKTKKQVILMDYLKTRNINKQDINKALNDYIKPCLQEITTTYCDSREIETLLSQDKVLDIKDNNGFYIAKNNNIKIAFNSHLLTATFEYNPKTKKIIQPTIQQ